MKIISTNPNQKDFNIFLQVQEQLYTKEENIFKIKNNPVVNHLECCYVLTDNDIPKARFAFYNNPDLRYKDKKACCIGSYECAEDKNISRKIIEFAIKKAKDLGFEYLIAPMEGSTWDNYRFSLHNRETNFFPEPYHHSYYNEQFEQIGFEQIAHYYSNIDSDLSYSDKFIFETEELIKSQGGIIRTIDLQNIEQDLYKIGKFSIEQFKNNFLYTPISPEYFVEKYLKIKSLIVPEFVQIIEKDSEIHALVFSLPDYADKTGKTLIGKSVVRRDDSPFKNIGAYFASNMNKNAVKMSFTKVIHAMIISFNSSRKLSEKFKGEYYKEYVLWGIDVNKNYKF